MRYDDWGPYAHLAPYEPWAECGEAPIDWFRREAPRLLVSEADILRGAAPYQLQGCPNEAGIYFLLNEDQIVYIGIAKQLSVRLVNHYRSRKGNFNRVYYLTRIPEMFLGNFEAFYIARHRPEFNVDYPIVPKELEGYL